MGSKAKLPSGREMPLVGFGTYLIEGRKTEEVINWALSAGYRLFDTACMYNNEQDLGKAFKTLLPKHNLKREDVFITSKLYPSDHGDKAYEALKTSLRKLDSGYIDLYLIHWPGVYGISSRSPENSKLRALSWQNLVKAKKDGLVKDIGVSNYTVRHLKELLANDYGEIPAVNQVEWHPYCHQSELVEFCKDKKIQLQAYMPLGGADNNTLLVNSTVKDVASKLGKTPAQVLLKWSLQQGVSVIPKSKTEKRIYENIALDFTISSEDMKRLSSLGKKEKYDWDPESIA